MSREGEGGIKTQMPNLIVLLLHAMLQKAYHFSIIDSQFFKVYQIQRNLSVKSMDHGITV